MNTAYQNSINIVALGLDLPSLTRLKSLFKVFKSIYKNECHLVENDNADLCIIDFDDPKGNALWQQSLEQYPSRPNIIIASDPTVVNHADGMTKPLNIDLLWEFIDARYQQTRKTTQAKAVSGVHRMINQQKQENKTPVNIDDSESLYYQPADYLQGYLQAKIQCAKQEKTYFKLNFRENSMIIIDPVQQMIYIDLPTMLLKQISQISRQMLEIYSEKISETQLNDIKVKHSKIQVYRLEKFLWDLTYLTANGRVPQDTNLSQQVFLQHWPNFTRLTKTPSAMRISALLVKHTCLLSSIPTILRIPEYEVFNFYSAANVIGLTGQTKCTDNTYIALTTKPEAHKKRNILSALLSHLGIK
ncbi:MAG: hypothetical protein GXP14_14835 [Gammaproteobacteria bacterium]|nr:hypothetical protein [Gammaproteobacteria bacterium]